MLENMIYNKQLSYMNQMIYDFEKMGYLINYCHI